MEDRSFIDFPLNTVPSPCFVIDQARLRQNLELLKRVQEESGAKILLAQKGFAMWSLYPMLREYLAGVCASGLHEALLGRQEFNKEVHTYAPAYSDEDFKEILGLSNHIVFNTPGQYQYFKPVIEKNDFRGSIGLRINPEYSTGEVPIYDPCGPHSRLGTTLSQLEGTDIEGIEGLHFHTLCEQNVDALEETLKVVEANFGSYLKEMKWVNFGGGHHITRADYKVDKLIQLIKDFRNRYGVDIYLEPGEAVALNTGILVTSVLDVMNNGMDIAILDTSATTHMPDVLEMPYRPDIWDSGEPGQKSYTYRLGGQSCLAGDVIGDYSFDQPLRRGDRIVFTDMGHYSMVKTTTFNGVKLPSIGVYKPENKEFTLIKKFGYQDFKGRLS
ncbi:carboxynorspermidine decarboxylase [Spirochaeta cellobiosiphila]|uniref:carboxynorspermidine decarboxylase n=1 Tax=Spirochaeta cellobiosiphila TaxID=504483 RepID=UPI0003F5353A|nr:carboxynorspermidine decarboxylase [Spirochaeta cellobiosiphila]